MIRLPTWVVMMMRDFWHTGGVANSNKIEIADHTRKKDHINRIVFQIAAIFFVFCLCAQVVQADTLLSAKNENATHQTNVTSNSTDNGTGVDASAELQVTPVPSANETLVSSPSLNQTDIPVTETQPIAPTLEITPSSSEIPPPPALETTNSTIEPTPPAVIPVSNVTE
jgi:hypothetical protein